MKEETLHKLQDADDTLRCEGPADRDCLAIEAQVRGLKPEVERFLNLSLTLEDEIQDAAFVAGLYSEDRVVCIRFSAWGRFFTIWDDSTEHPLSTEQFEPVIRFIEKHGFVHIDYDALGELYAGPNDYFNKKNWGQLQYGVFVKDRASWWARYFDFI